GFVLLLPQPSGPHQGRMLVNQKPRRGTGRLRAIAIAVPCALCLLAIPAQASESSSSSVPNGNACGHYKLDFHGGDLSASVGLSGSKTSKCAPDTPAPAHRAAAASGRVTPHRARA